MPPDKGNATVILNTEYYKTKMNNLLGPDTEKRTSHQIIRRTEALVQISSFGDNEKKKICESVAVVLLL